MAEADLKRKQEALAKMADYATKYDVERMQAVLEISRLHLEITNQKKSSLSSLMYLQWQMEVLRNQVLELQLEVKLGS